MYNSEVAHGCTWSSRSIKNECVFTALFFLFRHFLTRFSSTYHLKIPMRRSLTRTPWRSYKKARGQRRRSTQMGEMGLFSGLAYCADCGVKLYDCRSSHEEPGKEYYTCSNYRTKKQCSSHYIRAVVLEQLVLQNLQRVVAYAQEDEDEFVRQQDGCVASRAGTG